MLSLGGRIGGGADSDSLEPDLCVSAEGEARRRRGGVKLSYDVTARRVECCGINIPGPGRRLFARELAAWLADCSSGGFLPTGPWFQPPGEPIHPPLLLPAVPPSLQANSPPTMTLPIPATFRVSQGRLHQAPLQGHRRIISLGHGQIATVLVDSWPVMKVVHYSEVYGVSWIDRTKWDRSSSVGREPDSGAEVAQLGKEPYSSLVGREPDSGATVAQWVEHPLVGPHVKQRQRSEIALPHIYTMIQTDGNKADRWTTDGRGGLLELHLKALNAVSGLHCKLSKGVFRGRGNNSEKLQRVWRRMERGRQSMLVRSVGEWNVLREKLVSVRGVDKFRKGVEKELAGLAVHSVLPAVIGKGSYLTELLKGMIFGFRAKVGSISETTTFVNCSRAPRAIDVRGERRLQRCVKANRQATEEQLIAKMNMGASRYVSTVMVQRKFLRMRLPSRRRVTAPFITQVHRRKRLEFARQYGDWTAADWRRVAFFDESRFQLHIMDRGQHVRRETSENQHPASIAGRTKGGDSSVMVWGMFSWHSIGYIIRLEDTLNRFGYESILCDHVHPYMMIVFPREDGLFQHHNTPCQTARSVSTAGEGLVGGGVGVAARGFYLHPQPPHHHPSPHKALGQLRRAVCIAMRSNIYATVSFRPAHFFSNFPSTLRRNLLPRRRVRGLVSSGRLPFIGSNVHLDLPRINSSGASLDLSSLSASSGGYQAPPGAHRLRNSARRSGRQLVQGVESTRATEKLFTGRGAVRYSSYEVISKSSESISIYNKVVPTLFIYGHSNIFNIVPSHNHTALAALLPLPKCVLEVSFSNPVKHVLRFGLHRHSEVTTATFELDLHFREEKVRRSQIWRAGRVTGCQAVNTAFYCQFLRRLMENIQLKRPDLWCANPEYSSITMHPILLSYLAPAYFAIFPKMRIHLKGRCFDIISEIQCELQKAFGSCTEGMFDVRHQGWTFWKSRLVMEKERGGHDPNEGNWVLGSIRVKEQELKPRIDYRCIAAPEQDREGRRRKEIHPRKEEEALMWQNLISDVTKSRKAKKFLFHSIVYIGISSGFEYKTYSSINCTEICDEPMVRLLASQPREPGLTPDRVASGFSHVGIMPDGATGQQVFSGICSSPSLNSGAVPYSPRFALIGSQDIDGGGIPEKKSRPAASSGTIPTCENPGALEVAAIDLEEGVQTTPPAVKGTGEDMLRDGIDSCPTGPLLKVSSCISEFCCRIRRIESIPLYSGLAVAYKCSYLARHLTLTHMGTIVNFLSLREQAVVCSQCMVARMPLRTYLHAPFQRQSPTVLKKRGVHLGFSPAGVASDIRRRFLRLFPPPTPSRRPENPFVFSAALGVESYEQVRTSPYPIPRSQRPRGARRRGQICFRPPPLPFPFARFLVLPFSFLQQSFSLPGPGLPALSSNDFR
ncbi:hypothetical protein PR048_004959 [Dryococelus australis]|uniref:Transposase Tc1-like domain-containing protein n=1 Tax=Dryococelus australis TaxID=614101 RepID=A0ABQ9I6W6_9NEOP|nr:hypothetical protein PR048_004959 [Dryococelus australis]